MRLLFIRHAIAVPRGTPGIADEKRPLTPEGEAKFREAARGLAFITDPPEALLTSPLPRARRTAEIAARAWRDKVRPQNLPALQDADWDDLEPVLAKYPEDATVALVGHEPSFSRVLARLLRAREQERLEFRKGGAALVDVPDSLQKGGTLVWFLSPKILRTLGEPRRAGSRSRAPRE